MGKISGWPKSSLGLFHNILQENPNKLFGQSSTKLPFSLERGISCWFHTCITFKGVPAKFTSWCFFWSSSSWKRTKIFDNAEGRVPQLAACTGKPCSESLALISFPPGVGGENTGLSHQLLDQIRGGRILWAPENEFCRLQVPKPFYCLFLQEAGLPR